MEINKNNRHKTTTVNHEEKHIRKVLELVMMIGGGSDCSKLLSWSERLTDLVEGWPRICPVSPAFIATARSADEEMEQWIKKNPQRSTKAPGGCQGLDRNRSSVIVETFFGTSLLS